MISGASAAAGGTSGATACGLTTAGRASTTTARSFLVATAFLAGAFRFLVFAAFLPAAFNFGVLAAFFPADFNFRVRAVFFAPELRPLGMGVPLSMSSMWHRPYNRYLRGVQVGRLLGTGVI